ncbi:RCBT1 protein, partial [Acromyrmex charruanus]
MFKKKIKMFIVNIYHSDVFLVTQDVEKYVWEDIRPKITLNFEVQSTDNEVENEIVVNHENLSHYICYTSHKIDWSNTKIVKAATNRINFLALTDDGKIYYTHNSIKGEEEECSIHQMNIHEMNINEEITCMSCGSNFYVVATNSHTFYWGFIYNNSDWMNRSPWFTFKPHKISRFTFKTIVKIACGIDYTLALTDKGKLYGWGGYFFKTCSDYDNIYHDVLSPIRMNIINVKNLSDIAVIDYTNFVKSSKDGLVYAWGFIFRRNYKKPAVCEYTNGFDISNSMTAHSPMSVAGKFINEEFHVLNDLETAFNDQSTSDLTIRVEKQSIYVHKVILKIRSTYFRSMFQPNYVESRQSVIENNYYRYVVYKKFLEYLYTGSINLSSFKNLLDLLQLADALCEKNLQMDCIRKIKKTINVSNVMYLFNLINDMNEGHHKEVKINDVKKLSDIAVIDYANFVKSSKDGLVYAWGFFSFRRNNKKSAVCEYTNAFDISNSMTAHSPMSVTRKFINEEFHVLNDLETAFNDQSTSDLTIMVEKQSIYVHKVILKIRSTYFRSMFQTNYVENRQSVILNNYYRYVIYKKFLEYLYTGSINVLSFKNLLDLLQLADALCEKNLQMDCIRKIKKTINVSNVMYLFNLINDMNEEHHKEELMKYCFNFYFKNMAAVIRTDGFEELDVETKAMLIDKGNTFFSSEISSSGYLE